MISKNKKKVFISLLTLFLGVGLFFLVAPAYADGPSDWAGKVLGGLIGWIIGALGIILVLVMQALVSVAQYSNFIGAPAIMHGWKIVRDICNMFFVLVLLIIAFATILKIENYSYKKWLPKLILMAILINFSKTICGLLIDFAQVVMLTFVNAFKDMVAGNLVSNLGITDILTLANNSADVGFWAIVGAYVLGLIYVLIALVVIVTMLAMLVMRIVMIWIYVVLSPAAYLMSAFPDGQKYASQWWLEFSKNLIVGPVLAFFIWLSFVSFQTQDMKKDFPVTGPTDTKGIAEQAGISGQTDTTSAIGATNASTPDVFIRFIIAIGMLIGGLKISQEIGGAAGGIAGKGMAKISSGAAFAGAGALALAKRGGKSAGMAVINQKSVRGALDIVGSQKGVVGQALRFTGVRSLARAGSISLGKHKLEVEEKAKKRIDAFKKVGATRTLASIASGKAASISQKAARKEAQKIVVVPEERFDKTRGTVGLDAPGREEAEKRLKALDMNKERPSLNQITQLGKSGLNLANLPKFQLMLEKNSEARGAYNDGQRDAGLTSYVVGTDSRGAALTTPGRYGPITTDPDDMDRAIGRTGDNAYALRTTSTGNEDNGKEEKTERPSSPEIDAQRQRISAATGSNDEQLIERTRNKINDWNTIDKTDHFQNDYQLKEAFGQSQAESQDEIVAKNKPGSGSLSVNGFARGQQEYMGVDFNKLDPEVQKSMKAGLKPGQDLKNIKGVATSDKGQIKKIASSLIGVIDQEIAGIKKKGTNITKGDEKRLGNLETAKAKLKDPKKLRNIELINSSAEGYKSAEDVKSTIIHEDMHGRRGIKSESDVDYLTEKAMASPQDREEIRAGGSKFMSHLENKMDLDRGVRPGRKKSMQEVIESEDADEELEEYNLKISGQGESGETNITNITNITESSKKEQSSKFKQEFKNSKSSSSNDTFMVYYFKNFIRSMNSLGKNMNKNEQSINSSTVINNTSEQSNDNGSDLN